MQCQMLLTDFDGLISDGGIRCGDTREIIEVKVVQGDKRM